MYVYKVVVGVEGGACLRRVIIVLFYLLDTLTTNVTRYVLVDYESVEVTKQLEDVEKRAEDRSERTENGVEFVSTEVAKTEGGSEDIEDGLRLEAVEEKEDEHHQLDSGSENHPRYNPSHEGSQEILLDKGGGNFDHIDESQTILPGELNIKCQIISRRKFFVYPFFLSYS